MSPHEALCHRFIIDMRNHIARRDMGGRCRLLQPSHYIASHPIVLLNLMLLSTAMLPLSISASHRPRYGGIHIHRNANMD